MTPLVALPLLAGIGLLYAGLWTVYIRALNGDRPLAAAAIEFIVTSFSFAAWAIMSRTGHDNDVFGIMAYSFGGSVGTYTILRMKVRAARQELKSDSKDQTTQ